MKRSEKLSDAARRRVAWEYVAPCVVLFVLPVAHTTPLRIAGLVLSAIGAAATWQQRRAPVAWPRALLVAIAAWFAICAIASWASVEPDYSWGEFRNEVLVPTGAFAIFFVLADGEAAWRRFRAMLFASFVMVATVAVLSYWRDGDWLRENFVGDRNAFSTYVVLVVPFLVALLLLPDGISRPSRGGIVAALVLAVVAGACTQNRNMWFAIALEALVFASLRWLRAGRDERRRLRKRFIVAAFVGVLALAGVLAIVVQQKAAVSRTAVEEQARFDRDPRFAIWRYAATRIAERPWTGFGYGRGILRKDFREHFGDPLKWHGHNMVVDYWMEAGVAGALVVVVLYAALVVRASRVARDPDAGDGVFGAWALAMLVGVGLKVMTDDILVRESAILFWSTLGIVFGLAARAPASSTPGEAATLSRA